MDLLSLALTFFLLADPIGNIPAIAALTKNIPVKKQKWIMFRESILALLFAIAFQFLGEPFLHFFGIPDYNVSLAGGVLLFVVGFQMIFGEQLHEKEDQEVRDPFFVPIAVPLVTGGALLSSIILYSNLINNPWMISGALMIAWLGVIPILMTAPLIQRAAGKRGILALEQLMGMLLIFISIQLFVDGMINFVQKG
jgi:multiple antibiotic resistance protein